MDKKKRARGVRSSGGGARSGPRHATGRNLAEATASVFRVAPEQANLAIGAALRQWLPGKSWSDVQQLVRSRRVMVSGNLCLDEGRRLKAEEVVKLLEHSAAPPPKEEDVRIRYLDAHLVIVEKPAGMTTLRHPEERSWPRQRKQLQPTVDELLPRIIAKREKSTGGGRRGMTRQGRSRGEGGQKQLGPLPRVRPVHRIDRETSGLMVFARTVDAERKLGLMFRAHDIHRVYLAVALGNVRRQKIESNLVPDRGDGRRGSTRNPKLGKHSITNVTPIERLDGYTVVECRLETGRTHQIRIHLSEAGHPLCGDRVYRGPFPGKPIPDTSGAARLALHAAELGFDHPISGDKLKFEMPIPRDMTALINRLRQQPASAGS